MFQKIYNFLEYLESVTLIHPDKTYFIRLFFRWSWIFYKIYNFLENLQSVKQKYLSYK